MIQSASVALRTIATHFGSNDIGALDLINNPDDRRKYVIIQKVGSRNNDGLMLVSSCCIVSILYCSLAGQSVVPCVLLAPLSLVRVPLIPNRRSFRRSLQVGWVALFVSWVYLVMWTS